MNNQTFRAYIESLFQSSKTPDKKGFHIEVLDNSIWTIELINKGVDKLK